MTQRRPGQQEMPTVIGDENLHPEALAAITSQTKPEESVLAYSGFDWENKVIAITDQRVIVADNSRKIHFSRYYDEIVEIIREGRELVINTRFGKAQYRMGNEADVVEIEYMIGRLAGLNSGQEPTPELEGGVVGHTGELE